MGASRLLNTQRSGEEFSHIEATVNQNATVVRNTNQLHQRNAQTTTANWQKIGQTAVQENLDDQSMKDTFTQDNQSDRGNNGSALADQIMNKAATDIIERAYKDVFYAHNSLHGDNTVQSAVERVNVRKELTQDGTVGNQRISGKEAVPATCRISAFDISSPTIHSTGSKKSGARLGNLSSQMGTEKSNRFALLHSEEISRLFCARLYF